MKRISLLFLLFILFLILSVKNAYASISFGDGYYTNLYGNTVIDGKILADQHVGTFCSPSQGTCSGSALVRWVCDGLTTDCRNLPSETWGTRQSVNNPNPGCSKTVQIDVFDKKCRVGDAGWDCAADNSDLKDYMVWYSGSCATPTPTSTPVPSRAPTATPTGPIPTTTPTPTQVPTGVPTVTPTTTPTPIPDFNNAMCKCDGIDVSGLIQGQKAVVNTFGKVEGVDITKAQISSMTYNFGVASVKNPNLVKPLITPVQIPAVITENTSAKVRYKTSFEFVVPTPPANNPLYRVWTEIKCTKKTTAALSDSSQVVLGNSIQRNTNLFDSIKNAVGNLLTTVQTKIGEVLGITDPKKSLQLSPIYPAQVEGDYCSSFWYQFKNP